MELLVRVNDRGSGVHACLSGMTISACPDGWGWSQLERANPDWVIISTPITQVEADALTSIPGDNAPSRATSTRRLYKINVTGISHRPGNAIISMPAAIFRPLVNQIT